MSKPLGRPRARGTVAQNRAGTWYAVISAGTDPLTGERKRHWHRAEPNTRKAAEKLRTAKLRELDQQQYVDPSVKTLAEYLREWLDAHASQVRANTLYGLPQEGGRPRAPGPGRCTAATGNSTHDPAAVRGHAPPGRVGAGNG